MDPIHGRTPASITLRSTPHWILPSAAKGIGFGGRPPTRSRAAASLFQ